MGKLDNFDNTESIKFYENLGKLAALKGITVNLIALVGSNCNVEALS